MNAEEMYQEWMENPYFDEKTKEELKEIATDKKEIEERFYKELEFGTAGLRGIIGAGTNRMNVYTVRKATQGLANYIIRQKGQKKGVAIAYDSRHMSEEFAMEAALCLCANGIKIYMFDALRPTPELSYAVRKKGCIAGINITASHNPSEYNGYKVYWEDGAQITPPHDLGIMEQVKAVTDYKQVKTMPLEDAKKAGLFEEMGREMDDSYLGELKKLISNPEAIEAMKDKLSIVYTPLHGTGNIPVRRLLSELGFTNVTVVKEQEEPDGDFPTVSYPNPETEEAFTLGLQYAKKVNADLILATDPDADRLGVYVKDGQTGEYHPLTGNMSGCLIGEYLLSQKKEIPSDAVVIRSIVTTNMLDAIAKAYGAQLVEVLTGFKYIGQKILETEQKNNGTYLFGMEESYGCLPGTYARDKDAVVATMILCEAAAFYKAQGKTLWDVMLSMYDTYGYYRDEVEAVTLAGKEGLEKIAFIMDSLRKDAPKSLAGLAVERVRDYKAGSMRDVKTGTKTSTNLPSSNVLYYELQEQAWLCVRPSGTEPKIKFYFGIKGNSMEDAADRVSAMRKAVTQLLDDFS